MNMADCTVIVIGEGNEGKPFDGLVSMIDESHVNAKPEKVDQACPLEKQYTCH